MSHYGRRWLQPCEHKPHVRHVAHVLGTNKITEITPTLRNWNRESKGTFHGWQPYLTSQLPSAKQKNPQVPFFANAERRTTTTNNKQQTTNNNSNKQQTTTRKSRRLKCLPFFCELVLVVYSILFDSFLDALYIKMCFEILESKQESTFFMFLTMTRHQCLWGQRRTHTNMTAQAHRCGRATRIMTLQRTRGFGSTLPKLLRLRYKCKYWIMFTPGRLLVDG